MKRILCAVWLVLPVAALADAPSVSYIFPAGGQRGTTVEFHVGGHYLHDECPFEMLGGGVQASATLRRAESNRWFEGPRIPMPASQRKEDYPWPQQGAVTIHQDAQPGLRRWRVWTSQGTVDTRLFVVGELPEIVEQEFDGRPIPTGVEVPVTINGRIFPREDVDIWTFEGQAGRRYTCEVVAARIGSPLDSRLLVLGPQGQRLADTSHGVGNDARLRFTAPADGRYEVHIHDVEFGGLQHYVYRLTVTDGPVVDHVFPLGGRRGAKVAFQLHGQQVPETPVTIDLPPSAEPIIRRQVDIHARRTNSFAIELSDLDERVEDASLDRQDFSPPAVLNGCIRRVGETDVWVLPAEKGETFLLDVRAAQLGSRLNSVLEVYGAEGMLLAANDDRSPAQTDSRLTFEAPQTGRYEVRVRERFAGRAGERFAYRLYVTPPVDAEPDFRLWLGGDGLTVNRGGQLQVEVQAERLAGFNEPIQLSARRLPAGVRVAGGETIGKGKSNTKLVLEAAEDAPLSAARIQFTGMAEIAGRAVERSARPRPMADGDVPRDHAHLVVALPTPFKFYGVFQTKYAAAGSTFVRHYALDRGGFEGPITVRLSERQVRHLQGVTGPTIVVPPGVSEFDFPVQLAPWMEVGRTSRTTLMAVGDVTEPDGSLHRVSYTSHEQNDQIILLVDPCRLNVRAVRSTLVAVPGETADLEVEIERGTGLAGAVRVELVCADHIRGVSAEPVTIAADRRRGTLQIRCATADQLGPFNMPLKILATTQETKHPFRAEASVELVSAPRAD